MDIELAAGLLLIARIFSVIFIVLVLWRQWGLFKLHVQVDLNSFRKVLFGLSLVILLGNMVPMVVDGATAFGGLERSANTLNIVGVTYTFSNALTASLSSVSVWLLYRMAAKILIDKTDNKIEE